jgi:hypothetical protein
MKRKKNSKKDKIFYIRLFLLVTLGLAIFDNYKNATKVIMNLTQSWVVGVIIQAGGMVRKKY